MNATILLVILSTYGLSSFSEEVTGYVAVAGSEFEALDNPLGQVGVRYSAFSSGNQFVDLFFDHLSSFPDEEDQKGLNRVGAMYRYRVDQWDFFSSVGVRDRKFDYSRLEEHEAVFWDVGVGRELGSVGRFAISFFMAGLYGGETYFHSGLRASY